MKNRHFSISIIALLFGTVAYMNYSFAQLEQQISDLTLVNIECMAIAPDEMPSVGIPCKHTGNKDDCCKYYIKTMDGTLILQEEYFCVNNPNFG